MAVIVPVILVHLDPACDADVRLSFLALLETMLGMDAICKVSFGLLFHVQCVMSYHRSWMVLVDLPDLPAV